MRNVTVTLDEEVARWARVWAAKHDTSVSRMLGELLRDKMEQEDAYWKAFEEWKAIKPWPILMGAPRSEREEIYAERDERVRRQQRAAVRPRSQ
jgi:hypothetical protein